MTSNSPKMLRFCVIPFEVPHKSVTSHALFHKAMICAHTSPQSYIFKSTPKHTYTHTHTPQVILYMLFHAMYCIGKTKLTSRITSSGLKTILLRTSKADYVNAIATELITSRHEAHVKNNGDK